ncbi:MAG: hypothetical protein HY914_19415 [Desulfomonile tiedjei]|nr:hypothetical protein [Desulfomonile tiedjei]
MPRARSARILQVGLITLIVAASLSFLYLASSVLAGTYQPCQLPVVVGSQTKPNVMIVQDMSGSMQFAPYYDFDTPWIGYYNDTDIAYASPILLSGATAYQIGSSDFGYWDSDTHYVYDPTLNVDPITGHGGGWKCPAESVPADAWPSTAPPVRVKFTAPSSDGGGGGKIQFTAAGHGLAVGDWAVLYGLSSHTDMNANAYQVTDVGGDTFKVVKAAGWTWDGNADDTSGAVIKRVNGTIATGLSGNILSFLQTTRTDVAMKAMFGGRALVVDTNYAYLKPQGSRKFVFDETLGIAAHIRPGHGTNPDAYNQTGTTYYGAGTAADPEKDIFITIGDLYRGTLDGADPLSKVNNAGGNKCRCEVWRFTVPAGGATVTIRMWASGYDPYLQLYTGNTPNSANVVGSLTRNNDNTSNRLNAIYQKTLAAGDYCIEATCRSGCATGNYYLMITADEDANYVRGGEPDVPLTWDTGTYPSHNGVHYANAIGRILNARCQVRVPKALRTGVIQDTFSLIRYGYMYYKSDVSGNRGKILVGCENTSLDVLLHAMQGIADTTYGLDNTKVYPYYGTPTGEAMWEAYDYFKQQNDHSTTNYATNTTFITKAGARDPWYDPKPGAPGQYVPAPCRKSYTLLLSDGQWNGTDEPAAPARSMHVGDLRTDITNPTIKLKSGTTTLYQNVTTFGIMCFDQSAGGFNSMKTISAFGGFKDISGCTTDYPYTFTSVPGDSKTVTWPRTNCNPAGTWNNCCKEWDIPVGTATRGDGVPDGYFEADNGQRLVTALKAVLAMVLSTNASASAVATVSQQLAEGDTYVRGVFEASDPDRVDTYLWYGHLEAYWPYPYPDPDSTEVRYDFDLECNYGLRCMEMPGTTCVGTAAVKRHCWDGGSTLADMTPLGGVPAGRWVFTYDPTATNHIKDFNTTNITQTDLDVTSAADATNLINWTLGATITPATIWRDREGHRLGDTVYSTPVISSPPSVGSVSVRDPNVLKFYEYRNKTLADGTNPAGCQPPVAATTPRTCTSASSREVFRRDKIVFVGANDGMVHAFLLAKWDGTTNGTTGQPNDRWLDQPGAYVDGGRTHPNIGMELWAYIPSNLLKELKALAAATYGNTGCQHRAMVDLSPKIAHVYINPDYPTPGDKEWRTVLVGGERGGGDTYFAIDVTDPYAPKVLWEYSVLKDRVVIDSNKYYQPFSGAYTSIEDFPMSWAAPVVGRIRLPEASFYVGTPAADGSLTGTATVSYTGSDLYRSTVFVGGGLRLFDSAFTTSPDGAASGYTVTQWADFKKDLFKPSFMLIDVETGQNLFKYVWPELVRAANAATPQVFPLRTNSTNAIPYAMTDPMALDVWDLAAGSPQDDGFIDHIYVGDTTGYFYGIKFTSWGVHVDLWPTKSIINDRTDFESNIYRAERQPIAYGPTVSTEEPQIGAEPALRVVFAAGKYDDLVGGTDDKTDLVKMSLYNLRDPAPPPPENANKTQIASTGYFVQWQQKCQPWVTATETWRTCWLKYCSKHPDQTCTKTGCSGCTSCPCSCCSTCWGTSVPFNPQCHWVTLDAAHDAPGTPDCCESSCSSPCYSCVYDLTLPLTGGGPGERWVSKPLIAGGYVFATSFVPSESPCDFGGMGYLYLFEYQCKQFSGLFSPIPGTQVNVQTSGTEAGLGVVTQGTFNPTSTFTGARLEVGPGVPSPPVLDPSGQNVVVQMSDGTLVRTGVDLSIPPMRVQGGWQSSDK